MSMPWHPLPHFSRWLLGMHGVGGEQVGSRGSKNVRAQLAGDLTCSTQAHWKLRVGWEDP